MAFLLYKIKIMSYNYKYSMQGGVQMKTIVKKYNETSLILRIVIGLIIGTLLGVFLPQAAVVSLFGELFVGALKAIAPILVFILVISSLAKTGKGIGKKFRTVIFIC